MAGHGRGEYPTRLLISDVDWRHLHHERPREPVDFIPGTAHRHINVATEPLHVGHVQRTAISTHGRSISCRSCLSAAFNLVVRQGLGGATSSWIRLALFDVALQIIIELMDVVDIDAPSCCRMHRAILISSGPKQLPGSSDPVRLGAMCLAFDLSRLNKSQYYAISPTFRSCHLFWATLCL